MKNFTTGFFAKKGRKGEDQAPDAVPGIPVTISYSAADFKTSHMDVSVVEGKEVVDFFGEGSCFVLE
jgi:hypothetical protein